MSMTSILPSKPAILPAKVGALVTALAVITGAIFGMITSFEVVRWTPAQLTLAGTEATAFWAFIGAAAAHFWPTTKKQPVALAGAVTALVSATLSLGIGFTWWQLTEAQNASLISLVTAIVGLASAFTARAAVTADTTKPRE